MPGERERERGREGERGEREGGIHDEKQQGR